MVTFPPSEEQQLRDMRVEVERLTRERDEALVALTRIHNLQDRSFGTVEDLFTTAVQTARDALGGHEQEAPR